MTVRVPLHIKLMMSYLLVVGLVLLPTAVYLRTSLIRDQHARAHAQLQHELDGICRRLSDAPPDQLVARTELLLDTLPTRLTVVDVAGNVLGDTLRRSAPLENHAGRPEIRDAFARGVGYAIRKSATAHQVMVYTAMRFPRAGPARGVARLSEPESAVVEAGAQVEGVIRNAAAVALSVAVLLSLVAAVVASRPLRRITSGARAFADGDFGAEIDVHLNDEIGEVAEALSALASQLRTRLVATGAERATLQALLDDLPVGVVLFDASRRPVTVNGAARALCGLEPFAEAARGAELPRLDRQMAAVESVLRDGFTVETALGLPWRPEATLTARWFAFFGHEGERRLGVVVIDREAARRVEVLHEALARMVASQRRCLPDLRDRALAAELMTLLHQTESLLTLPEVRAENVRPLRLEDLCRSAAGDLEPWCEAVGARFEFVLPEGDARVVDVDDRARRALRVLLRWGAAGAADGAAVVVRATPQEGGGSAGGAGPRRGGRVARRARGPRAAARGRRRVRHARRPRRALDRGAAGVAFAAALSPCCGPRFAEHRSPG